MDTNLYKFNRNKLIFGNTIETPSVELVKNSMGLWNASLEDAIRYGGDLTKAAISAMNLRNDRKYIVADVKVHMLMPGFYPAIPGWHTDGVPRNSHGDPAGKEAPDIFAQELPRHRSPRFHLLVTGEGCLTEFLTATDVWLDLPAFPTTDLYRQVSAKINNSFGLGTLHRPNDVAQASNQVIEFNWWNLHQGIQATKKEWRYLIRVTETDHIPPQTDLRQVIRTQHQCYAPAEFGW